jgi:AraC-like DNA-binding protein
MFEKLPQHCIDRGVLEREFVHAMIIAQMPTPMELWRWKQVLGLKTIPDIAIAILVDPHTSRTRFVSDRQKFTLREQLTTALRCAWPLMLTSWHENLEYIILLTKTDEVETDRQAVTSEIEHTLSILELPFGATLHAGVSHVMEGPAFLPSGVRAARDAARQAHRKHKLICHEEDIELYEEYGEFDVKDGLDVDADLADQTKSLLIQKAMQYITNNLHEDLELEKIASHCLVSHYYLSHLFRKETGTTVTAFIKKARIDKAMDLLLRPDYSVADVAYSVGYQDPNYFSKSFRTHVGMTPTEFRRKIL